MATEVSFQAVPLAQLETIEDIYDSIGGFGLFQVAIVVLVYGSKGLIGASMMLMSYAGFINDFICVMDDSETTIMSDHHLYSSSSNNNISGTRSDYANNSAWLNTCEVNDTKCSSYIFLGTKRTAISEWSLVCDKRWMKATITSIQMFGVLAGSVLGGLMGDYWGRWKTFYGSLLVHMLLNAVTAFSSNWQMFTAMRFFIGVLIGTTLVLMVPYPTEFFPRRWRHLTPSLPFWPIGVMLFAGAASLLEDWSILHLGFALVSVPFLLGGIYVPDSPRWLATQGKLKESLAVLRKMAAANRKTLPDSAAAVIERIAKDEKASKKNEYTYWDLFRTRKTTKLTIIFSIKWCVLSAIFYGLNFAVSSFAGNLYLNIFLMNVIQLPAHFLAFGLIERIGYRTPCLLFLGFITLASFACLVIHVTGSNKQVISLLCLVAKLCVSGCWAVSQVWVTGTYPTVIRSLGYGFANTMSRIGGILAPFIINLDQMPTFTYSLMVGMGVVTILVTYFVPDIKNQPMQETNHDGAQEAKNGTNIGPAPENGVSKHDLENGVSKHDLENGVSKHRNGAESIFTQPDSHGGDESIKLKPETDSSLAIEL